MEPTITKSEAESRVEKYVEQAAQSLPSGHRLELSDRSSGKCTSPTDGGSEERIVVSNAYWIRGLDPSNHDAAFDAVKNYWTSHGWKVLADDRPEDEFLWVENKSDGFRMSIQGYPGNKLDIGTDSPCIWPEGTPPPSVTE